MNRLMLRVSGFKYFGAIRALNEIDIAVAEGQIHGIIGPNGSGKTTLLNWDMKDWVPTNKPTFIFSIENGKKKLIKEVRP